MRDPLDPPYPSLRQPVMGDAVVATSQPLATTAGMDALADGGNAIDAALAAAITLTITEPTSNGIGGDLFAIVAEPDGSWWGIDASGRAPEALDPEPLLGRPAMPLRGWETVTVPGAPSGWAALAGRGTLGLERLVEPAARSAEDGYAVAPITAAAWARGGAVLADVPGFAEAFLPGGRAPRSGERFALPAAATTLRAIGRTDADSFYRGALAEQIIAFASATGGMLSSHDLAAHAVRWVDPLSTSLAGWEVAELGPPTQGIAALIAVGICERLDLPSDPDDPLAVHLQIEAVKHGLAVARREVADPDAVRTDPADLIAPAHLDELTAQISPDRAQDPGHGRPAPGGTVYLAAGDPEGRVVSLIQSNYYGFGSGFVVPGTGISLHNRGAGFSTDPDAAGAVGPGLRPFHTIIPGALRDPHGRPGAFGVMGGPLQPQGHTQVAVRCALAGQGVQTAIDAPRWRVENGMSVALEPGWPDATIQALVTRGHQLETGAGMGGFGGAQAVIASGSGWVGASDPRKDGHAAAR